MERHTEPDKPLDGEIIPYGHLAEKPDASIETVRKAMQGDKEAFSALFMQTYRPHVPGSESVFAAGRGHLRRLAERVRQGL